MKIEPKITFEMKNGQELLLQSVHYDVQIDELMAKTSITQNYTNPYDTNIEAIYTFPLAMEAVLLSMQVKINDRVLKGSIVEKNRAEAKYEEAIDEGNRAIMVEKSSDGIYTVNIANLLPKDNISVIIEYVQLLEWRQDQVKWSLPTTIAPKYGNVSSLNLDDVTAPSNSLFAENLFTFTMRVKGILADSKIDAPSHQVNIIRNYEDTFITLKGEKDFMNKDIVFTFKTQKDREDRAFALIGKDIDGYATIASFYPSFGKDMPNEPKSVTFVIDCSGSMMGVSIARAKTALTRALTLFNKEDSFNIIKFGSNYSSLFDSEVLATEENIEIAKQMINLLEADMGGTEMEQALQKAYDTHVKSIEKSGYLFLITDGQIYNHQGVINSAQKSEMAHFIVGLGYASDDSLLRSIATKTRGSYENIDPNEKMDDYILNLFKKIDTPKAQNIKVQWPIQAKIEHTPKVVYDGDTIYAYAIFKEKPIGEVKLSYTLENQNHYETSLLLENYTDRYIVSKLVIAKEIEELNSKRPKDSFYENEETNAINQTIVKFSIRYQLFSELTNYILVDEIAKDKKPISLPKMHKIDNMHDECLHLCSMGRFNFMDGKQLSFDLNLMIEDDFSSEGDLWESIPSSKYEYYLIILDKWFIKYNRLPRKKDELLAAGFDTDIVALFDSVNFREEVKEFTSKLYSLADSKINLSLKFIGYIKKIEFI